MLTMCCLVSIMSFCLPDRLVFGYEVGTMKFHRSFGGLLEMR